MALEYIQTKTKPTFSRRDLLIVFSALLVIIVGFVFPQAAYGETLWFSLFLFAAFPAVIIAYLLKEPFSNFGISWGKPRAGIVFSLAIIALFVSANYFLLQTKYGAQLSIPRFIVNSFTLFLAFEIFISLPLHFFWEFFFRGFLQLGLEKRLGIYSLLIAALVQSALYFRSSWLLLLLVFFSSAAAGLIVRQSRSIVYSALSLWLISVSLDIMIIRIAHQAIR